uniref:L1 52k protein n=1 Tax=Pipistrellus pipistrellus adenovirus TaxID=3140007 RepID=A0AAU6S534_9ADEN
MHPVLRQMRPLPSEGVAPEGDGIARVGVRVETHPRVQMKRDAAEAFVPRRNILRDEGDDSRLTEAGDEGEGMRHLKYTAGKALQGHLNSRRELEPDDFELDPENGVSPARAHLAAADLVTAYEQTVKEEANFQKRFNNNVRTLLTRHETTYGLMHLWDFMCAYLDNPASKTLTAQLFLIVQHSRDDGVLRETLLNIADPSSRWLVDLVNVLQSIVVQERGLSVAARVAAINYAVISLSKHYARKIFKTPFVPLDKEAKISTFYMRCVMKLLVLSDDLGMYRNERMQRVVSSGRKREMMDHELMFNLRRALAGDDDEELEEDEEEEDGYEEEDVYASPSPVVSSQHGGEGAAQPRAFGATAEPAGGRRKLVRFV